MKLRVIETTPLRNIAIADISVMAMLSRFGIKPGYGNKTVEEICKEKEINIRLFLLAINEFLGNSDTYQSSELPINEVIQYLQTTDRYFLEIQLPNIKRHLRPLVGIPGPLGEYLDKLTIRFQERADNDLTRLLPESFAKESGKTRENHSSARGDSLSRVLEHDKIVENELEDLLEFFIVHLQTSLDSNMLLGVITAVETLRRDVAGCNRLKKILISSLGGVQGNGSSNQPEQSKTDNVLTNRETEVLGLLARGLSNKEVADKLCISLNTAITHRRNLASKLGIRSLAGLSLYAYTHGLLKE